MKVFDFTDLKRGQLIREVKRPHGFGSTHYDIESGEYVHICIDGCHYHQSVSDGNRKGDLFKWDIEEKFGVPAVCFCTGKVLGQWNWIFVCTHEFFMQNKERILNHWYRRVTKSGKETLRYGN